MRYYVEASDIEVRNNLYNALEIAIEREIKWINWDISYINQSDDNVHDFALNVVIELSEENPDTKYPLKENLKYSYILESSDYNNPLSDCSIESYNSDFGALNARVDIDKVVTALIDYVDNMVSYQSKEFIEYFDNVYID